MQLILGIECPVLVGTIYDLHYRKRLLNADSDDDDDDEEEDDDLSANGVEEKRYKKGMSMHLAAVQPK